MSAPPSTAGPPGALVAIVVGLIAGAALVYLAGRGDEFDGRRDPVLAIHLNGLPDRMARDLLLPDQGWVLEIELPPDLSDAVRDTLSVTLRAERTGATIEIADRLVQDGDVARLLVPKALGLFEGLLSIKASLTDEQGRTLEAHRRTRIRTWLGGPPIGARQVIHFDFEVDRSGDGRPEFHGDLERLGLATAGQPDLARVVGDRIAARALARVARAYDDEGDPNHTGLERDPVRVRFALEAEPSPFVTRICVGGDNPSHPGSVGYVRFDWSNKRKRSQECDGDPASGVFPAELTTYEDAPLFREVLDPFRPAASGVPFGAGPGDEAVLATLTAGEATGDRRTAQLERAIAVIGDVLGTVLAHESAHALGLVPGGRPAVGLFGGADEASEHYAHNLDAEGRPEAEPWLMNAGRGAAFEALAGEGEGGELRFRPINYAYLRDRLILAEGR